MITYMRRAMAALAVASLAACGSNSATSTSATIACWPESFRCEGYTPGFWSNKNGCAQLLGNPDLCTNLNAFLADIGYPLVSCDGPATCAEVEAILKVSAEDMSAKLLAMWTAFALNFWNFWDEACFEGPIDFKWKPDPWLPGDASPDCKDEVDAWFSDGPVTFGALLALVQSVYESEAPAARCEQETLKNFFDAANNDANVCACDCPKEPPKEEPPEEEPPKEEPPENEPPENL